MITVEKVTKTFRLYRKPTDRLKEIFLNRCCHTEYHALNEVTFTVADGETVGIIGRNGAGKSTLLKILSGVLLPDHGTIITNGRITGLLELGTGFNMDKSGLDNITTNGLLLGMNHQEIKEQQQAIIRFAELGSFIEEPLRTYSSGMVMRLAFAIAIHANPRCFLVDEALAVGDAYFQQKCLQKLKHFQSQGGSILFVSHDLNAIKMLCNRAILLENGQVLEEGLPEQVVNKYNYLIAKLNEHENKLPWQVHEQSYGNLAVLIESALIKGADSQSAIVSSGELTTIELVIKANQTISDLTIGILIRDKYGQDIFGINNHHLKKPMGIDKDHYYKVVYSLPMNIGLGKYTVTAALHSGATHVKDCYHWCDQIIQFEVVSHRDYPFTGICKLRPQFSSYPIS